MNITVRTLALLVAFLGFATPSFAAETSQELAEAFFYAADPAQRAEAMDALTAAAEADPSAQYALGAAQFLNAVEQVTSGLLHYGLSAPLSDDAASILDIPLPTAQTGAQYEEITYAKFVGLLNEFGVALNVSMRTLAKVPRDATVDLVIDINRIALHVGPGMPDGTPFTLGGLLSLAKNGHVEMAADSATPLVFHFDRADVYWLEGYEHVITAAVDFTLAHDFERLFNNSFTMFFPFTMPNHELMVPPTVAGEPTDFSDPRRYWQVADLLAMIHLMDLKVIEPGRRAEAAVHLGEVIRLSRLSWNRILKETDNDREWLPGPMQEGVHPISGTEVTKEQVIAWIGALDVAEKVLSGDLLLPHWRFAGKGVNLAKFFAGTENFDPVLLLAGPGAVPYLDTGEILDPSKWDDAEAAFGPLGFFGTAFWFN